MIDKKVNLLTGLVALAISIPSSVLFENSPIRPLPFIFGIATFSLLVFVLIEGYYVLEKEGLATTAGPKFGRLLGQIFLGSKIVIGFSLLLTSFLFFVQFVAGLISYAYRVDYKLLLPFILLAMIGGMFLRDPAAAIWLDAKIKWLTPYVKAYSQKAIDWLDKAKPWVMKHNRFIAAGLIVIFIGIMLPFFLEPVPAAPKELTIEMPDSLNRIDRDYDQRLKVWIYNSGVEPRKIFLEAEPEEGEDTLIMGFAGSGSNFEKIQAAEIAAQSRVEFILVSHAATANKNAYPVKIKLFTFDKGDPDDSVKLVDSKTVNIEVLNGRIDLSYEVLDQEPTSLARIITITNKGTTISDFSLIPDSSLQHKVRIIPEIKNMRFEKGAAVKVLVEPVLKLGFASLKGNLLLAGGGASSPIELPLAFNAPEGKRLFLAVAGCGSRNHTLINECINQRRNRVEMSAPPAFNGAEPHDVNTGVNPSSFSLPNDEEEIPGDTTATYEEPAPEYDSAQSEEIAGELERGRLYGGTTRDQILSRTRDLQQRFEALREDFEAGNAIARINGVIENLRGIPEELQNDTPLTPELIGRIDEKIQQAINAYDLLNSEEVWNNRRELFISALGQSEFTGSMNLRMDDPWLGLNNGAAPAIFFSSALTHFAWHRSHTTNDRVQSVHYSAHHADGKVSNPPFQMNAENEVGRWPSVVGGENSEVFFAWQGGTPGENHEIRLRVSKDGGKTWDAAKQITSHSRGTYSPRMVYKDDRLFLMWTDFRNGVPQLMLSYSTNKGDTFSQPVIVSRLVEANGVAKFDVGVNHIHCVYEKNTFSGARIFYNRIPIGQLEGMYEINEQDLTDGTHPSIIEAGGGEVHLAFVRGEGNSSEIYYTSSNDEGGNWSGLTQVTHDEVYSISPSVSLIGNSVRLLYHSNISGTSKFIDHLYFVKKDNASASWSEALRLPGLTANGKRVFLSAKFKLPWDRRIYNRHDVKVFFNGKLLGRMNDNIPEGSILFPVDPSIIHHADFQNNKNVITLTTEHFNPAHYLATSEFALIADLSYIEQFIFAENQQSADEYLAKKSMFNHNEPDLGLYTDEQLRIPLQPGEGEEINIKLRLWNLGDGECTNSTIDIYGGPANLSENSFQDRYILGQKRLGLIRPMENTTLNMSFTYWPGLEKVFIRVRTKEKDFDPNNNVHVLTFAGPMRGPVDAYYGYSMTGGVLRVAVFDQPGELAKQADIQLYESGMLHPYKTSEKNPQVWLLPPGKYDVQIKKPGSSEIEQWIRGVNVWTAKQLGALNSFENTVSLDILMQKVENSLGDLEAVQSGNTITFTLPSSILFHSGQFEINPYAADFLKNIKTLLHAYQDSKLTIEGHTDKMGSTSFNQQLSEDRANAVKQWLTDIEGIEANRLTTVGYGDSQPVADNDTESGRAKNRRVDFILNRTNP